MLQKFAAVSLLTLAAAAGTSATAQLQARPVSDFASDLGPAEATGTVGFTVHLKLPNEAAFHSAVDALYNPESPTYHHWMTNADLAKYAPSAEDLQAVRKELESHGLTIVSADPNGFSLHARGPVANVQKALNTSIHQFRRNGTMFRAATTPAKLSGPAGAHVNFISGLQSHAVHPLLKRAVNLKTNQPFPNVPLSRVRATSNGLKGFITGDILLPPAAEQLASGDGSALPTGIYYGNVYNGSGALVPDFNPTQLQDIYGLTSAYKKGYSGQGQTIVLLEAYGYPNILADANAFSTLTGLPQLNNSNFQIVYPEGKPVSPEAGVLTGWDGEIALDVQWAHAMAPQAKIVVVAASGQDDDDFEDAISYITSHNLGYSVSSSWEVDVDLIAGAAEQQAFEAVLERGSAKGISFQFSTGDSGDEGLGTPLGASGVPSTAPHATAVGGTSLLNVPGTYTYLPAGWGDTVTFLSSDGVLDPPEPYALIGGGGGGESLFWKKPSWQASLPGTGRQTPDVSALADPYTGVPVVLTVGNTQQLELGVGGTSLASPLFTGMWAIANQAAGQPLGQAAPLLAKYSKYLRDVLPTSPESATNVSGTVVDANGATFYSANDLFSGLLYGQKGFTSALWNLAPGTVVDFGFGIDSSLTVTTGWDNVTGYGTPNVNSLLPAINSSK